MTDEELWLKHIEEYPQIKSWSEEKREGARKGFKSGLAEGRKEKELSYKVGKVTKAELNKCNTIEEKMEWLGKVLGYAIFKDDMNYAVWVNVQKNNIIESIEKENAELKKEISVLLSCSSCSENKGGYVCEKEYNDKCLSQKIEYIKELKEEITELKEQIEKMKCCGNCKHDFENGEYCCNPLCTHFEKWEKA